jgi:hypothetical protein
VRIRLDFLTLETRREAMLNELEYLLKTHSDHEALSDQSSLRLRISQGLLPSPRCRSRDRNCRPG